MRGADLIFFRNRGGEGDGTLADLVHQTAMYYEDRLTGAGFARVILAGGGQPAAEMDEIRRSLAERLATSVDSLDPRTAAALTDRISAAPTLLDTLAPLVGLLLRGPEGGRVIQTNLSTRPFYNERVVNLALVLVAVVAVAATLFNITRFVQLTSRDSGLSTQIARDEARAADLRAAGGAAARDDRSEADRARHQRSAQGQRSDRPPHVLVDGALQPLRDDAARGRPHHVGAAEGRHGQGHDADDHGRRQDRRGRLPVHGESRGDRRLLGPPAARRSVQRSRAARNDHRHPYDAVNDARDAGGAAMTLLKRILFEKRSVVVPLALVLLVNIGVYAFVVYPLSAKAANAEERAAAAAESLQSAQRDLAAARALATGKTRADQELTTFYDKVLPENFSSALRKTYLRVPALARKLNVKFEKRDEEIEKATVKDQRYGRIKTRIVLQGDYEAIRQFVYELETAPEFVIIDDVALAQSEADKPLTLTLALSTYYRLGADGT